ncbi:AAA family ATPase [Haliangium sp.]|uniref:AAA family ATPase n=1 Tax=Haliangium sp. TaxID=2663208 RepID=UPI003D104137
MSRSGRFVAIRQPDGLDLVDALGTAPRRSLQRDEILDFGCVGPALWVITEGRLDRYALDNTADGLPAMGPPVELPVDHGRLYPVSTATTHSALWIGYGRYFIQELDGAVEVEDITGEAGAGAFVGLLGGRRLLIAEGETLRVRDLGRGDVAELRMPVAGTVVACASLFGGRAIAVLVEGSDGDGFAVLRPGGGLVHHVTLPRTRLWSAADNRGVAVVQERDSGRLMALDLRYGKVLARVEAPVRVDDVAVDSDGKYVALAGRADLDDGAEAEPDGNGAGGAMTAPADTEREQDLSVLHMAYTDLFGASMLAARRPEPAGEDEREAGAGPVELRGAAARIRLDGHPEGAREPRVDAAVGTESLLEEDEPAPAPEPVVIPKGPLHGLGKLLGPVEIAGDIDAPAYEHADEHLEDMLDLVTARVRRAIAEAWDNGRLSNSAGDELPFFREVHALAGAGGSYAEDTLQSASKEMEQATARAGVRAAASLKRGMRLPFVELAREFELDNVSAQALLIAVAPVLRGEVARLYGILANDENRPVCDRHLIELLLGGSKPGPRGDVAHALRPGGTLVRRGLLRVGPASREDQLFAPITVDQVLIERLRGDSFAGAGPTDVTSIRWAECSLEELFVPDELKRDLVLALAGAPRDGRPYRVVLRGRRGSGRRSLAAALARRVRRPLAVIDCERLPRSGTAFAAELGDELMRAGLRGAVACLSGLEVFDSTDTEGLEHVRATLRNHPAPFFVRTSPEFGPPLDPGYLDYTLPTLSEAERFMFWTSALERHALHAEGVDELASRFRVGPGTVEAIIAEAEARVDVAERKQLDFTELLDEAARQHIQNRMSKVAQHIERLARWEQVALPDDVLDSIREFIGRVRHRRTVYDHWGFDRKMSTSRGLTALFYGPPGTGKSMVAGLIARELGLDLYRVDLARITSKWIGETEKNLAEVFDAAEDGQCIILFDEADSLFAKRTEVKSSVDRYANLEVNYLLQRLDSFEGVAILTTNMEGSIDKAFKRRMSLRLAFPFPDEDMRVRLWAAHIPPEVPTEGDFDFADLARRFPMSGGYIRNSALRAAFLAAQEDLPMTHEHLERAINLEYREMGKLAPGGRME